MKSEKSMLSDTSRRKPRPKRKRWLQTSSRLSVSVSTGSWMDPSTKAEAQAKLTTLYVGIGYPETWKDYSAYEVKTDDIFGNVWRGNLWEYHRQVARLGKQIDRKEWSMTPQTVNAV